MLNVVCVLKKPDMPHVNYNSSWVQKLQNGVARNLTVPFKFICLSDMEIPGVNVVPLENNWPIYWSKLEIFRPGLYSGPTVYLDIDSMITGNIDFFYHDKHDGVVMLTDWHPGFKNSSVMWWDSSNEKYHELYAIMKKNPMSHMVKHRYKGIGNYGDQEFVAVHLEKLGISTYEWQKIKPNNWFLPFSAEGRANPIIANPPNDVKICYCLGSPKFDAFMNVPFVMQNWR